MELREYQREALRDIERHISEGMRRLLVVLPCGTGKTVIATHLPDRLDARRTLFLVHRDELVWQAVAQFSRRNPAWRVSVEKAESHADLDAEIVIASVQSLRRRLDNWPQDWPDLVIVDEAHHSVGASYVKILRHFGLLPKSEPARAPLIGITATPRRGDDIALGNVYDSIGYWRPLEWFIAKGYLVDVAGYRIETRIELSQVKIVAGDFDPESLAQAVDTDERNRLVVDKYLELAPNTLALAFTTTIRHAERLASAFRDAGVPAWHVSGETTHRDRTRIFQMFRNRKILVIASSGVLNEGLDLPMAETAIMARPTCSALLYTQQVGRVMRPCPPPEVEAAQRKTLARVLDFVDNSARLELVSLPTLFGLPAKFNLEGRPAGQTSRWLSRLALSKPYARLDTVRTVAEAEAAVEQVSLLKPPEPSPELARYSRNLWVAAHDGSFRLAGAQFLYIVEQDMLGIWKLWSVRAGVRTGPLAEAKSLREIVRIADSMVPEDDRGLVYRRARWRKLPPTPEQCRYLWSISEALRKQWSSPENFYQHALLSYYRGDDRFSRGNVSQEINRLKMERESRTVRQEVGL